MYSPTRLVQTAGGLASAWLVWIYWRQSLASLIGESLIYVALAWFAGALITFCVYLVVSLADLPDVVRFSLRSSAPAMWFAPSFILLSIPIPAALVVSFVLIANATRLLVAQWVPSGSRVDEPVTVTAGSMFFTCAGEFAVFSRNWGSVLLGSFTAQAGLVAMLWKHPLLAAACLACSAAVLTSLSIVTGAYQPERPPTLPPSLLSILVTFLLACTMSVGGIAVRRGGGMGSGQQGADHGSGPGGTPSTSVFTTTLVTPPRNTEIGDGFPGVVLLPLLKPHTILIPPAPATRSSGLALTRPVGIPFSGEYWLFKPPRSRPPLQSIVQRGTPDAVAFHTTDGAVMQMEAHQRMDPPVDVRCCSRIQLVFVNTDRYPGTIGIELILVQSEPLGGKFLSLGIQAVDQGGTLNFAIPTATALQQFDEFKIVFHRSRVRADKSARIAIERFVLVP